MTDVLETTDITVDEPSDNYFVLLNQYRALSARLASAATDRAAALSRQQDEIARLVTLLESVRRDYGDVVSKAAADSTALSELLQEAFDGLGFASSYDTLVENNYRLKIIELADRLRSFRVTVPVEVTIDVEATDDDNAVERVREAVREIERTIDTGSWDGVTATAYPQFENSEVEEN
jgi:hypothetical protein